MHVENLLKGPAFPLLGSPEYKGSMLALKTDFKKSRLAVAQGQAILISS